MTKGREANSKPRHTWIPAKQAEWQITAIRPSPENNRVYRPVLPDDPEIQDLSANIKERGVLQPLVISEDGFIISGHRRHVAAQLAGLITVPCVVEPIRHDDDPEAFLQLLVSHNKQRVKTHDERVREELVNIDPDDAYNRLLSHRHKRSKIEMAPMAILGAKTRSEISAAKQPFLAAIKRVLNDLQDFWPLSDRQIHYGLLNDPPLRHARKPGSRYVNDKKSYNDLVDLLTRARLANEIPWNAIDDETRPVEVWSVHQDPSGFIRAETSEFLFGYWRVNGA
ncbi:MAG: ParB N-terminal domain-containing protein [Planctomycetia bacterium]|nr:ParB N-terminal domain-containing protein [Planctomycetia bacterium]